MVWQAFSEANKHCGGKWTLTDGADGASTEAIRESRKESQSPGGKEYMLMTIFGLGFFIILLSTLIYTFNSFARGFCHQVPTEVSNPPLPYRGGLIVIQSNDGRARSKSIELVEVLRPGSRDLHKIACSLSFGEL